MTTATYAQPTRTQPTGVSGAGRLLLPLAALALGAAGTAISVVAITTDDVADVREVVVVESSAAPTNATAIVDDAPLAGFSLDDDPETCAFARLSAVDRC